MDSVVLLDLLSSLAPRFSWRLSALHVHHGISLNADAWADFCAALCARHDIPLTIERVDIAPLRDHGIEAAARKLRHAAFARQPCDFVALAHHADDQAETLLLQLLRGAGVKGAAAMPFLARREGAPALLRPLLHCSRQDILDYAAAHELQWIEDESNADDSYPRNFLRHRALPLLEQKFPEWRSTLSRSAQHFAEASGLLDELAQQDAVQAVHHGTLDISALQALSLPRAKNLLRYFLHRIGAPMPQAVQLDDMLQQLCDARRDAAVCVNFGDWQVMRYQGRAYAMPAMSAFEHNFMQPWNGESELDWPALSGRLKFEQVPGAGISLAKLRHAPVTLRLRSGGETLCPHLHAATRTLKKLLQEHQVPPWRRERLPLLYCGDELVCVAGVAIAAGYQAGPKEAGVRLLLV
ncbi:tRNA(Ile)-lysidine synthase [Ferrigenium kumadai]|uniref:tRNA(Ile)-lysidine synthase n=1 Tax=Ferrigenium kumadai TaxID=1682490 RepID=A0AAN1VZV8_9PROT|nr:tRNA(Ile)-lysidine synthase [Ferrigenium kumadai]